MELLKSMNNMYYIYHIPNQKIGVTSDLHKRVTVTQGYRPDEYEILECSSDIDYISNREIELQKYYGYKVDKKLYKDLFKKVKLNSASQTTSFPVQIEQLKEYLEDAVTNGYEWQTPLGSFTITNDSIKWILQNAHDSQLDKNSCYIYNKAFYEAFMASTEYEKENIFGLIRDWAEQRGIYDKGDVKTQLIKLYEETGELSEAILKNSKPDIVDAIGDCIVVLTNLAKLSGFNVEDCIQSAYDEISSRTGEMKNGVFEKNTL